MNRFLIVHFATLFFIAGCALLSPPDHRLSTEGFSESGRLEAMAMADASTNQIQEVSSLIRWSGFLVALGMLGILLPDSIVKPPEAFTAILAAFAFFALARWATAAAPFMAYVIPICSIILLLIIVKRFTFRPKSNPAMFPKKPAPPEVIK